MRNLLPILCPYAHIHLYIYICMSDLFSAPGKNSAQTDEEKQRERQRNEREQKHAELEAQHIKVSLPSWHVASWQFLQMTLSLSL